MQQTPIISLSDAAKRVETGRDDPRRRLRHDGNPVHLLHALAETDVRDLTYIANNVGEAGLGGGRLLRNGQIKKAIGSYFTSNREAVEAAQSGAIEIELMPQGTLAEALPRRRRRARRLLHADGRGHYPGRGPRDPADQRRRAALSAGPPRRRGADSRLES